MTFSIGVDLGGTNLRVAAVDAQGKLLEKVTLGTRTASGREAVLHDMCDAIRSLVAKHSNYALKGIGIGVPGILDLRAGVLRESPNLKCWAGFPVRAEIEKCLGAQVILENDANAAAFGEHWLGAARDVEDMAILTLGTGIGSALLLGGKIWYGMTGMAGEFGHMTLEPDGLPCKCGNRGCLEMYASATAVVRMAREATASGESLLLERIVNSDPEFSAKAVYNLVPQGDEVVGRIFRRVGRALGIAVANLVNALNLPLYVIGGGVSNAWDAFSPAIFEELQSRSMVYAATALAEQLGHGGVFAPARTIVTRALLGSDAGLYGAARLPFLPQ